MTISFTPSDGYWGCPPVPGVETLLKPYALDGLRAVLLTVSNNVSALAPD